MMTVVHLLLLLPLLYLQSKVLSLPTEFDQDFDYLKLVYDATDLPLEEEYDYIVIGGGTAGCPLAATLSENYSVLLLERGGTPHESPNVLRQEGILLNLLQEDDGNTPVQKFTSEDGVVNARGRVLGGSSMINVGFYSRGDGEFYEKSGIKLDMDIVEKAYQWVEDTIVSHLDLHMWQYAIRNALLEAGVRPDNGFTLSHLEGTKVSGSTFDKLGRRHGAVELLNRAEQKNLRVGTHATVDRILFSSSDTSGLSAIGIIYTDSVGKSHRATLLDKGEVILSAGAIGSPQLLLLSGVGPSSYLSSLKIPVVHDHPYVGKFMFDNPRNGINIAPPFPLEASIGQVVGISGNDFYIESSSSRCPFYFPPPFSVFPASSSSVYLNLGRIMGKIPGPNSNGSLQIASSTDVKVNPVVRFNYFSDPIDLTRCIKAMRKIGEMLETPSLKQFMYRDLKGERGFTFVGPTLPANYQSDDAAMENFCRTTITTMWHFHGGCLVGKVVDDELRVTGINALRVVDGSTFSTSPGTNPQATVMMLGRYIGLRILKERMEEETKADCNGANEDDIFNKYVCPVIA